MQNVKNDIDTWKAAKNPLCVILLDTVGNPPPLMVHLPLKWRNEDPVAFGRCINASSMCFADLLAQRFFHQNHENKAFLSIQEEKDEEEWKEANIDI